MQINMVYILVAAVLHITEEFFYPGGFMNWIKKNKPGLSGRMTARAAIIVNSAFLLLCVTAIILANSHPAFALSVAGLIFVNGTGHVLGSIVTKSYSPGTITGILLYLPISIYIFLTHGLTTNEILLSILYGLLYHLLPALIIFSPLNKHAKEKV
jgi:hypothetical protein